jgi:hypothetical protein
MAVKIKYATLKTTTKKPTALNNNIITVTNKLNGGALLMPSNTIALFPF